MVIRLIKYITSNKELEKVMATLTELQTAEATQSDTIKQILSYLQNLPAVIAAAQSNDQATIDFLKSQVESDTAALQAALAAAPPVPPAPPPAG